MSPFCVQNDTLPEQLPVKQSCEQQSPSALQGFPVVLQEVFSAAHLPPVQVPPQQSALALQAFPSGTQK